MTTKKKTTKKLRPSVWFRGRDVLFRGFDGKDYFARVTKVHRGVATLVYDVNGKPARTRIDDATRLFCPD